MDILDIDPEVLLSTADAITAYCAKQRETINVYYAQIRALEDSWQDDETFGAIVQEITLLRTQVLNVIEEINLKYPNYFRIKAQEIMERPVFKENVIGITRVVEEVRVPSQPMPYHGRYNGNLGDYGTLNNVSAHPNSLNTGGSFQSQTNQPSGGVDNRLHATFNVSGVDNRINNIIQRSFASAPDKVIDGIYKTTDRLEFIKSNCGSYYNPSGIERKSVIAIDYNCSDEEINIVSLVGQHVFYYASDNDYYNLLENLKIEGNNNHYLSDATYQNFVKIFKEGIYIPNGQKDEKVKKKAYTTATRFFVECFSAIVRQDKNKISLLKKYFPKSYSIAVSIIKNDSDELIWG